MSNGEVCCILGVCCPAGGKQQLQALIHEVHKQRPHLTRGEAHAIAVRILKAHNNFADIVSFLPAPAA